MCYVALLDVLSYRPMKLSLKSTLSETLDIVGSTSFLRQSRASGHLDMMCTSSGTFVSSSKCSWSSFHVRASQKMLNRMTTAAIWNRDLLGRREPMLVLWAACASSQGVGGEVRGRRGVFTSIGRAS